MTTRESDPILSHVETGISCLLSIATFLWLLAQLQAIMHIRTKIMFLISFFILDSFVGMAELGDCDYYAIVIIMQRIESRTRYDKLI